MLTLLAIPFLFLTLVTAAPVEERSEANAATHPSPTKPWPSFFTGTTLHPYGKDGRVLRHKCLDVAGQVYADGTHVQMYVLHPLVR